jgi:hypothetical protein
MMLTLVIITDNHKKYIDIHQFTKELFTAAIAKRLNVSEI